MIQTQDVVFNGGCFHTITNFDEQDNTLAVNFELR